MEPKIEVDSLGQPTGLESESVDDSVDIIDEPFDPERIDVITRNPTIDLLLSRIRNASIDLQPEFQRLSGIWSERSQSRLIESLMLRIPLPTLYAAEDENERWAIVDGVQRLTTITRFMAPDLIEMPPLRLTRLEYLGGLYDGASFNELPGRMKTRLSETELVVHLIRQGTPEEVKFNIFARLNTGGSPLSPQELRHALISGQARDLLRGWAADSPFQIATGHSIRPERMGDREMVLRFMAFLMTDPNGYSIRDFDEFLRRTMRRINDLSPDEVEKMESKFTKSMIAAHAIFGDQAFRRSSLTGVSRSQINKALFETVSVNLARLESSDLATLMESRESVVAALHDLAKDIDFERAISTGTGDPAKVRYRFAVIRRCFLAVIRAQPDPAQ